MTHPFRTTKPISDILFRTTFSFRKILNEYFMGEGSQTEYGNKQICVRSVSFFNNVTLREYTSTVEYWSRSGVEVE